MLFLIGAVSLNVMPFFLPRPQNSWVSGSSVELLKALLLIRKHFCAITPRYFISPRSWSFAEPTRVSVRSRSIEKVRRRRRFSLVSRGGSLSPKTHGTQSLVTRSGPPVALPPSGRRSVAYAVNPANLPANSAEDPLFH